MISAITKRLEKRDEGFTLIELLVVVIIIGILAAIAIPVFLNQRERAWERATMSDMRNAAVVMEEVFSANGSYDEAAGTYTAGSNPIQPDNGPALNLTVTDNVTLVVTVQPATDSTAYTIVGSHSNLTNTFTLNSTVGSVQPTTP